jgi:endonuclease YncB( thermonuclease family)
MNRILLVLACLTLQLTPAYVKRTLDGDTFALYNIGVSTEERVRVLGVDTPERGTGPLADSATAFTKRWLAAGDFTMATCTRDSFGRLLAIVNRGADTLAVALIARGLGVRR